MPHQTTFARSEGGGLDRGCWSGLLDAGFGSRGRDDRGVQRRPHSGSFTINLTAAPATKLTVAYFIIG